MKNQLQTEIEQLKEKCKGKTAIEAFDSLCGFDLIKAAYVFSELYPDYIIRFDNGCYEPIKKPIRRRNDEKVCSSI